MAPTSRSQGRRGDPNSGYWTRMRSFERGMLRNAFMFSNRDIARAAASLGMPYALFVERAATLGGITDDDPKEPFEWKTWSRKRKSSSAPSESSPNGALEPDELEPDDATPSEHEDLIEG